MFEIKFPKHIQLTDHDCLIKLKEFYKEDIRTPYLSKTDLLKGMYAEHNLSFEKVYFDELDKISKAILSDMGSHECYKISDAEIWRLKEDESSSYIYNILNIASPNLPYKPIIYLLYNERYDFFYSNSCFLELFVCVQRGINFEEIELKTGRYKKHIFSLYEMGKELNIRT